MQLARRFHSRFAAGLGLAMAAILLPTAALASSAAAGGHGQRAAAAACRAQHIRAWYGLPSDGGAGTIHYWFQVSNIGRSTCTISGRLRVTAVDSHGHQVGLAGQSPRATVTLKPLSTAYFVLGYIDVAVQCAHPRHATEISVRLPGQAHGNAVPFSTLGCPARSVLDASALHPGAGIPQRSPF